MFCVGLQKLIDERNLTSKEISEVIGQSVSQVGMYIQGRRDPDTSVLLKLSKHYNVSVDALLMNEISSQTGQYEIREQQILNDFLSLPDNIKQDILNLMKHINENK